MRSVLTVLVGISLSLQTGLPLAAGEPYGKGYVAADDASVAAPETLTDAADPARLAVLRDQAQRLLAQIQRLEYEQGPYGPGLAESFGDLARIFDEADDREGAMAARERALHLLRVNEGLSSAAQGPLVRELLDSLRRSGDFESLDARYDYFFRLYGAGRPPWTELRWAALMEYLAWQRQALVLGLDGDPRGRLYELHERHDDLLDSYRAGETSLSWQRFLDLAMSQLDTYYLLDDFVDPRDEMSQSTQWDYGRSDDLGDFDLRQERLENLQRSLRTRVRGLLEETLAIIPPQELRARAKAELALADWLQWQGSTREARSRYEGLWLSLRDGGFEDLAEAWFSQPTPLPVSGAFLVGARPSSPAIPLRLEVSEYGRPKVDPVAVPASLERVATRLRRLVFATRFRPQIVDGVAVNAVVDDRAWRLLDP